MKEENKREMKLWEEERKKHDLKYPDEYVVRFLHKNFKTGEGKSILDFGCGSGRNTIVMADMGFEVYALDYNDICLLLTKEKMEKMGYESVAYLKNMRTDIPIATEQLDCVVAWGALFYCNSVDRNMLFQELHRILKPEGLLFADFRAKEDSMFGKGKEIEKNLFILDREQGDLAGINYWFCGEEEIRDLYAENGFEIVNLEKKDFYINNMQKRNSHWHIWAKRRG